MLSDETKAAIYQSALDWLDTPFRQHTEIRGVGADCVHLVRGIMVQAGFTVPGITIDGYPLDWAKHRGHSLVIEWLERSGCVVRLPDGAAVQPGDVLCVKQGRCSHHIALMVADRQFIHTSPGRFAEFGHVDDPSVADLLDRIYRHVDAQ